MTLARYGFQKLLLLNSAGYSRAELPLDDSVSIIAPNNTGKTSLINALQFLLILDKRHMDFGAHGFENSRRFYFPDNSAYILLEVLLPSGMAVIGCVGKGLSHDYEYFAYRGSLDADDYRLDNGNLVTQPKLLARLIERGKIAKIYPQVELRALLYGNRAKLRADDPDLTIFPLEMTSQAAVYQRILTRTLRLDRLDTKEVKDYLLEIFKNDLNDRGVDFKSEWDKSFADVNHDKAQYDAVLRHKALIDAMQTAHQQRKALRGRILQSRPPIEQGLNDWEAYCKQQSERFAQHRQALEEQGAALEKRAQALYQEQAEIKVLLKQHESAEQRRQELSVCFEFVADLAQLETQRGGIQEERDELLRVIKNAEQRASIDAVRRDISSKHKDLANLRRQMETLDDNLYLRLQTLLPAESVELLNRLLAAPVLSLPAASGGRNAIYDEAAFRTFAQRLQQHLCAEHLELPGLSLDLSALEANLTLKSARELQTDIGDLEGQLQELQTLLKTAESLQQQKQRQQQLETEIRQLDADIKDYRELLQLRAQAEERQQAIAQSKRQLQALDKEQAQAAGVKKSLAHALEENKAAQMTLQDQHQRIDRARRQRCDQQAPFAYLEQLPYLPCVASFALDMTALADHIEGYNRDCRELLRFDEELDKNLNDLHRDGVSKFQYEDSAEKEWEALFAFAAQLPQEQAAIERKARSAVVQVAAILRDLRNSLETLKLRMREFNHKINRRQLSDLKVFRIEPREEEPLVKAIQTLIATSEQVESGNSFDLFDHHAVLDDKELNRAKDLLIKEGEARGSLKVEHLFRLAFVIAKENQAPAEYDNIDSSASNGTVLMAKLITGLAMLNQMQDPRKAIKTACYLDEAASLDQRNQRNLIETAAEFGFTLIFASPEPQITARYCVPIGMQRGKNYISRLNWQILEPIGGEIV